MKLFDEVSGSLREVEVRPRLGVYVCGITPYDAAHLGHAFTYVHMDVLVRYLRHLGAEVIHVQNVTDVDDDMLRVARERGEDHRRLAKRENAAFRRAMDAIGVLRPTIEPWASEFVPDIVEEVEALLAAGHAYERNDTVYFRVASDPDYGKLSRLDRERMVELAAERGGHPDDHQKDDPLDFVLWQRSAPGEPRWESPWGPGRPGWHMECSTMALRLLGWPVDVHGGGSDLIFPHHESEIAQAECVPGRPGPFVLHWMHTGAVHLAGEKMSKSMGNIAFVDDLLRRHEPAAMRAFLLRRHYRHDWEFDEEELASSEQVPGRGDPPQGRSRPQGSLREAFFAALDRDLDTSAAIGVLDLAGGSDDPEDRALVEEGRALLGLDV